MLETQVLLPVELKSSPNLFLEVYDYGLSGDSFLGRLEVSPVDLGRRFPGRPSWRKIYMDYEPRGKVLCSFQLLPIEDAYRVPPPRSIIPRMGVGGPTMMCAVDSFPHTESACMVEEGGAAAAAAPFTFPRRCVTDIE